MSGRFGEAALRLQSRSLLVLRGQTADGPPGRPGEGTARLLPNPLRGPETLLTRGQMRFSQSRTRSP